MLDSMYLCAHSQNSDIVICDYYELYNNTKETKTGLSNFSQNNIINYMLSNPSPWNKLIKSSILKDNKIQFLEHHIYEDLATLPLLAGYVNNISYINKPLYNYIIHENSSMRQLTYNSKLDSIFIAIKHLEEQFKTRQLYDQYLPEIEFLNIYHLLYAASGRFLEYSEGYSKLQTINNIIKNNYPNWKKNKYYKLQNLKIKLTCNIFFSNNKLLIYLYNKTRKQFK